MRSLIEGDRRPPALQPRCPPSESILEVMELRRGQVHVQFGVAVAISEWPVSVSAKASPRSLSFDKRDQCSASAIQRILLAGSRVASFLHSAARALHSNWVDIGTPCLRVDLILANLRQVPFSDYCPQGQCPNGQVTLTGRSGAGRSHAEICLANRVCNVTIEAREIVRFRYHDPSQSSRHRK